jgi:NADPH:quinone reductase-like Zn-dependent oxidoreductase
MIQDPSMRAFAVRSFGEPPAIHNLPIPAVDGVFLMLVRCAGVTPLDSLLIDRLTLTSQFPFVMGIDFAGIIGRAPAGAKTLSVGDRVFGMARTHGSYAEYTAVAPGAKTEPLAHIPDGITDEEAAALPIPAGQSRPCGQLRCLCGGYHLFLSVRCCRSE